MISRSDRQYLRIRLASPEQIRSWANRTLPNGETVGRVTRHNTIHYKTHKPERDGLFCERIFGPVKSGTCACGKYFNPEKQKDAPKMCELCGIEYISARARRHRMGYVQLACPVTHIWYFKRRPSFIASLLQRSLKHLASLVYCDFFLIKSVFQLPSLFHIEGLFRFNGYSWKEALRSYLSSSAFLLIQCREITTGGRAVQTQLAKLNLLELKNSATVDWYQLMQADPGLTWWDVERMRRKKESHLRRIRLINHLIRSKIKPEWMVFSDLPVLPPDLRPMLELKEGELISSDLNELYRRVVCRNNTLIDNTALLELTLDGWAGLQKKLIQLAVDQLLDNSKVGRPVKDRHDRIYKAFSDLIQGKEGRFRENLLGKRVDYSGRSVIAVGPYLKLEQCGLPEEMAMELFQPFVIRRLIEQEISPNLRAAKSLIQRKVPIIWNVLQNVVKEYAVLLNRAPTLHRLGIQAFQPILTRERAIRLHPLVCTGFNADFDGDQMAVHVPLAIDAQMEARLLMFADQNLLSPATGEAIAVPSQDMLLGLYVLTLEGDLGIYSSRYWPTEHFSPIDSVLPARIPAFSAPLQVLNTYLGARLHPHSPIWMAMNQQTLVIHDVSFDEPIETQYQVFGDNLSIYEYGQTRANRHGHSLKQYIYTTVGRVLFNYYLQEALQRPYGSFPL